jgi:hypothetical protein
MPPALLASTDPPVPPEAAPSEPPEPSASRDPPALSIPRRSPPEDASRLSLVPISRAVSVVERMSAGGVSKLAASLPMGTGQTEVPGLQQPPTFPGAKQE